MSRMNKFMSHRNAFMSHMSHVTREVDVTHEYIMSRMDESCRVCLVFSIKAHWFPCGGRDSFTWGVRDSFTSPCGGRDSFTWLIHSHVEVVTHSHEEFFLCEFVHHLYILGSFRTQIRRRPQTVRYLLMHTCALLMHMCSLMGTAALYRVCSTGLR